MRVEDLSVCALIGRLGEDGRRLGMGVWEETGGRGVVAASLSLPWGRASRFSGRCDVARSSHSSFPRFAGIALGSRLLLTAVLWCAATE